MKNGANDYIPKNLLSGDGIAQSVRYMVNMKEQSGRQRELEMQLSTAQNQLKAVVANSPIILFAVNAQSEITLFEKNSYNYDRLFCYRLCSQCPRVFNSRTC